MKPNLLFFITIIIYCISLQAQPVNKDQKRSLVKLLLVCGIFLVLQSCLQGNNPTKPDEVIQPRFEKITYFEYNAGQISTSPFQSRLTYYFDNGLPHKWVELDSTGNVLTDYIYQYDSNWIQKGAIYKEPDMNDYAIEKVTFPNDSTQVTEWLDSLGNVYYKMIDNLNENGKTYRATFIGDKIHGYDSTFYTPEGFEKRIFFTNTKGKVYNDRVFQYDSINDAGDWVERKKIINDTISEIHKRSISYDNSFLTKNSKFYEGILSTGEWDENVISFTENEEVVFFTRGREWQQQLGFIAQKKYGIFTLPQELKVLDTIYNGAISPSGNKIIFCKRQKEKESIWLIERQSAQWQNPKNLSENADVEGGYFYWFDETELYFYSPANNGDLVSGYLQDGQLNNIESLAVLNTKEGTEFSPYIDKEKRFLIFTRYLEGDLSQQGFFVSYNKGSFKSPIWSVPEKIEHLPYGWGAWCSKELNSFFYTDGEDLFSIPLEKLDLRI